MAIIDVVKYEQQEGIIVHKYPSCDLRWGTQLVVYPGQIAFFVKGGKICDKFTEGTYTLKTNNIPILSKVVNIPFGGDTPFQADIWFVNTLSKLNLKWGTETPIQLEDPKYNIIVPVRAYGQYGFMIKDAEKFVYGLVGNKSFFSEIMLQSYFRGILLSKLTAILASRISKDKISIFDIPTQLIELSQYAQTQLSPYFADFGIELLLFNFISINIPDNDESLKEIKQAKNLSARLRINGREDYKMQRSFDVMDKAAENEGGIGAAFVNAGLGFGASVKLGEQVSNSIANPKSPPPIPVHVDYYLAIDGKQCGPYSKEQIVDAISRDPIVLNNLAWKHGMKTWNRLKDFEEFDNYSIDSETPPPIPNK